MEFYCWNCESFLYEDELGTQEELMDPGVPGSWQRWTVCGRCGADEFVEVDHKELRSAVDDLQGILRRDGTKVEQQLINFIDEALESLYE